MRRPFMLDALAVVRELALNAVVVMLLVALSVAAATEFTLTALPVVNVFCFVPTAAEIRIIMSAPPT